MCHQTVSLIARVLEQHNIPTVIIGSARDIVEHCGVPRFLFSDFPLGNPIGKPYDKNMQRDVVQLALSMLEAACEPNTTVDSPFEWSKDQSWRNDYMRILESDLEALRTKGEQRRRLRAAKNSTD